MKLRRTVREWAFLCITLGVCLSNYVQGAELALPPAVECHPREGLANVTAKLKAGGAVRVAYLGGSITAQEGWRPQTTRWLTEQFPTAKIEEINASIGGTGSDLGAFRLRHDVLEGRPDLLFVEFAVNDGGSSPEQIHRGMEGIVRQTWKANPATDICFVYTLAGDMLKTLQEGHYPRAASAMEQVAEHYGIPSIHMGLEVARLEKEGQLIYVGQKPKTDEEKAAQAGKILFSPDAVHPYPETGHLLYAQAVQRSMAKIQPAGKTGPHLLSSPLRPDNWEKAQMISFNRAKLSPGWRRLEATNTLAKNFAQRLPEIWHTRQAGESVEFRFRGTAAKIYDLVGPDCGQVTVEVDGQKPQITPRFDAYCTYHRLATLSFGNELPEGLHTIKVTVHPEQPDKAKILAERQEKMDDAKRFEGTEWYAGAILIVGEWVE